MTLERIEHKVFASEAPLDEMGQFGSALATTKLNTKDVAEIQALPAYTQGWGSAIISENNYPAMEEMNGVLNVMSYHTGYLYQEGVPVYSPSQTYSATSWVKNITGEKIYRSKQDENRGNDLEDSAWWEELKLGGGAGLQLFDTILKDHILTYEESKGLALQGTYVYKDAIAGSRYGYPDFYNKCLEEYGNANTIGTPNVTIKGSLSCVDGVLSGFSASNYAVIEKVPSNISTLEIVFKVKSGSNVSGYNSICGQETGNYTTPQMTSGTGSMSFGIPISSESWGTGVESMTLTANTTYWFKGEWTGAEKIFSYSTDGVTWTTSSVEQTACVWTAPLAIGIDYDADKSSKYWTGSIDLNESYININGERWWNGGLTYKNPNGHIFYDISQKDQIDEIFNSTGTAWFYGIDTENERVFLPRDKENTHGKLIESIENGTSWCRVYSDGFCEQGYTGIAGQARVTLLKPFKNTDYTALATPNKSGSTIVACHVEKISTSEVKYDPSYRSGDSQGASGVQGSIIACGYVDIPNVDIEKYTYICVGNTEAQSTITDVIDVTTTENDTIPLFTAQYFDFTPSNLSWLKAGQQANSGGIYATCYNELVNVLNGETKYGDLKVVDTTDMVTGVDYSEYWKVNQADMTFTTPSAISLKAYDGTVPVAGNGMALGVTDGTHLAGLGYTTAGNISRFIDYSGNYGIALGSNNTGSVTIFTAGKSCGVTTDATKSGIVGHLVENTTAQLYFKVANAVQNLELLNAGEVLESVNSVIPNNKELITDYILADYSQGILVGTVKNATITYTAPVNGYIVTDIGVSNGANSYLKINGVDMFNHKSAGSAHYVTGTGQFVVAKGDSIEAYSSYSSSVVPQSVYFYPMKGVN